MTPENQIDRAKRRYESTLRKVTNLADWLRPFKPDADGCPVDPGTFKKACDSALISALDGSTTAPFPYLKGSGLPALDTACRLAGVDWPDIDPDLLAVLPGFYSFYSFTNRE